MKGLLFATCLLVMAACATVSKTPDVSSQLERSDCQVIPETLSRVTVEEVSPLVYAIGCTGCLEIFIEAQHQWLQKHYPERYPGYSPRLQYKEVHSDPDGRSIELSCFALLAFGEIFDHECATDRELLGTHVCFYDSGKCREEAP